MLSHFHLYEELRSSGVMGRRNGPSGLHDDDDDELDWKLRRNKNTAAHNEFFLSI